MPVVSLTVDAAAVNAICNGSGNSRPRFSARRRMPRHAFGLKKYRGGIDAVSSTEANDEHAAPSLGQSEVLSIENPPASGASGSNDHTRVCP